MPEIRKDPLTGHGVIIAPERAQRPKQFGATVDTEPAEPCPFCPGNENLTPPETWAERPSGSQPNQPGWSVRVVPNKYPAVSADTGVHEVIVESAAHVTNLAAMEEEQFTKIFHTYRERLRAVRADRRWRFVMIFKNQGERAGATFEHAHAQLIAIPLMPMDVENELSAAHEYHRHNTECYYCGLIKSELQESVRVVTINEHFIALCPMAPRFAFETWILPRVHTAAFEEANDEVVAGLARTTRQVIGALDRIQANPPFNFFIQSLPLDEHTRAHYHWQLRVLPQFSRAAGFEWGSGLHINPVAPENAAQALRDALV